MSYEDVIGRVDAVALAHLVGTGDHRQHKVVNVDGMTWCGLPYTGAGPRDRYTHAGAPVHLFESKGVAYCRRCREAEDDWNKREGFKEPPEATT